MEINDSFDDIRPFRDSEVNKNIKVLLNDPTFSKVIEAIFKGDREQIAKSREALSNIQTVKDFQLGFIRPFMSEILKSSCNKVTIGGLENFDHSKGALFVSNHRDIVMDSAILNTLLYDNSLDSAEIAIGSNLLVYPWIETLVKLNKSFVVKRDIPMKQMLLASKQLSAYIRDSVTTRDNYIWIAQKEGRAKDGDDKTQASLLKMLNMSNGGSVVEGFSELNVIPLSISYEIEPVGKEKINELLNKKHIEGFKKSMQDDLDGMAKGFTDQKGSIHMQFGAPLNLNIEELDQIKGKNNQIAEIASRVDREIHLHYKLWPNNYVAHDILMETDKYREFYCDADVESFVELREERLKMIASEHLDEAYELWNKMYACPVINREKQLS